MAERTNENNDVKHAILRTLIYSDLFSFPLTEKEIWKWLKIDKIISPATVTQTLKELVTNKKIFQYGPYYTLHTDNLAIIQREKRIPINKDKRKRAESIAAMLSWIPTIQCIGISGSLAAMNADKQADIDYFIIVKKDTLWISRLALLLMLAVLGKRRSKHDHQAADKCCINMIMSDENLAFSSERHDVYTAHEIAQVIPLYNSNDTYERFLQANAWIATYLANTSIPKSKPKKETNSRMNLWLQKLEPLAKKLQIASIEKTITTETITPSLLAFHPKDHRKKIVRIYKKEIAALQN